MDSKACEAAILMIFQRMSERSQRRPGAVKRMFARRALGMYPYRRIGLKAGRFVHKNY